LIIFKLRCFNSTVNIFQVLVDHGADVNARSSNGMTPLHDAINYLSQEIVDYLVDKGADPNIRDNSKRSAVELAPAKFLKDTNVESVVESVPDTEDAAMPNDEVVSAENEAAKVTEEPVQVPVENAMEIDQENENPCLAAASDKQEVYIFIL